MQIQYKLLTTRLVPRGGFCVKNADETVFSHPSYEVAFAHASHQFSGESREQIERRIEEATCQSLVSQGHYSMLEVAYPPLQEQGDVTIIPNELLLPAPHNYNAGLFRIGDNLVMCYRRHLANAFSEIAVTEIDWETLLPIGKQRVLEIPKEFENEDHEDARIFWHNDEIYVSYTMWRRAVSPEGRWLYMPRIDVAVFNDSWKFQRKFTPQFLTNGTAPEKNWTFFSDSGELYFVYDFERHVIGKVKDEPECVTVSSTPGIRWDYGTIRGSTPPQRISETEYLSFYHSRKADTGAPYKNRYYAGAYCFETKEPFRITRFTERPVFVGSEKNQQWETVLACVFPCGLVIDDNTALVSMGSNDMECAIARVDILDLLGKMTQL